MNLATLAMFDDRVERKPSIYVRDCNCLFHKKCCVNQTTGSTEFGELLSFILLARLFEKFVGENGCSNS